MAVVYSYARRNRTIRVRKNKFSECCFKVNEYEVFRKSPGHRDIIVRIVFIDPRYSKKKYYNDIALLRETKNIEREIADVSELSFNVIKRADGPFKLDLYEQIQLSSDQFAPVNTATVK